MSNTKRPPHWVQTAAVAVALVAAACGGAPTIDGDPRATEHAPASNGAGTADGSTTTSSAGAADFGCDPTVIRDVPIREWQTLPGISSDEAVTAPELSRGRMRYLIDAGPEGAVEHYGATAAELAAIDAYWEREAALPQLKKVARKASGGDWGGYWLEGVTVVVATAGDPAIVEEALAEFVFPIEVVTVSFRRADLVAWRQLINAQATDESAQVMATSLLEPLNALELAVAFGSTIDLTGIPCTALDVMILGDVANAPWHEPDGTPPPDQPWGLEARPPSVAAGGEVAYGPGSAPCAEVEVWSEGVWRATGLAIKTVAWNSEAADVVTCQLSLNEGFSTLVVPDDTLPGWYRVCLSDSNCALIEVTDG